MFKRADVLIFKMILNFYHSGEKFHAKVLNRPKIVLIIRNMEKQLRVKVVTSDGFFRLNSVRQL